MLHAKYQEFRTSGSGEEDFKRFLPYIGVAAIYVFDLEHLYNFSFPFPWRHHMKFCFDWPSGFGEDV